MLDALHQHGLEAADGSECRSRLDALADAAIRIYAPLPGRSLSVLLRRLRFATPQWQGELTAAIRRATERLSHARVEGMDWYWPADEKASGRASQEAVRFLSPFDPVVWDRMRFELLWGWVYRFEGYTPPSKRRLGYYALPLLWRERVVGWANMSMKDDRLVADLGYFRSRPRGRTYSRELEAEKDRIRAFLRLPARAFGPAKPAPVP